MPEAPPPLHRVPPIVGEPAKSANFGGAGVAKDKGFAGFALAGQTSLVRREASRSRDLGGAHLVKPTDLHAGLPGDRAQVSNRFVVRPAQRQRAGFRVARRTRQSAEIPSRDHNRPTVFNHERVGIPDCPPQCHSFGAGLARAEDEWNLLVAQSLQASRCGTPGVGLGIEQGAVEVGEDKCARRLRDDEKPPLRRPSGAPWLRATDAPYLERPGQTRWPGQRRCRRTQWRTRPTGAGCQCGVGRGR